MKSSSIVLLCVWCLSTSVGLAQDFAFPQSQPEHQLLQKFVGEWESTSELLMGPDQPPLACTGKMSAEMLGDFWMVARVSGEMMGTTVTAVQTVGYNDKAKSYVGTWVDSSNDHCWNYRGSVDETGKVLTLEAEGPRFDDPNATTKYRDIYEFVSADVIVMKSQMMDENGEWIQFMQGEFRRKK